MHTCVSVAHYFSETPVMKVSMQDYTYDVSLNQSHMDKNEKGKLSLFVPLKYIVGSILLHFCSVSSLDGRVWSASRIGNFIPDKSALSNKRLCSRKEKNIFPRRDRIGDLPACSLVVPTMLPRFLKQECTG